MCGITGLVNLQGYDISPSLLKTMTHAIKHRGPDGEGNWINKNIGLGHRRLSILDLSDNAKQPMASSDGNFILSYNGEIYNHLSLREELIKSGVTISWRGYSDTETLLACIDKWGVKKSFQKSIGMFAVAILDIEESNLFLVRDRMGEKPLYYGFQAGVLLFASELKAIKKHPNSRCDIDRSALAMQL